MIERSERDRRLQTKPCWSWSGAEALDFARQTHDLERFVAMLPEKKSSADEILNFIVDLRSRFQRWMHQDEFGPTRRQQTAALRALKKSLQTLQRQLAKGGTSQREQLNTMLRAGNHISAAVLERLYEGADDLERNLRTSGASGREIDWALRIKCRAEKTMAESQSLDTNTDGEILPIAIQYGFDPHQTYPVDFSLVDAEQWLTAYWNVVDQALRELNKKHGAAERVSLKLLVDQLCEFWERETARDVTAHGMSKLEYTQRTETDAGRFITAAIGAMLPEPAWFDEHSGFSNAVRARTFLPSRQADRARQTLVMHRLRLIDRVGKRALVNKSDGDRASRHCGSHTLAKMQGCATLESRVDGVALGIAHFIRSFATRIGPAWRSDDLTVAPESETNGVLHAVTRLVLRRRCPAYAQRGIHFSDGIQGLFGRRLISVITVFVVTAMGSAGCVVIGRNDGQAQILPDRRQVVRKAWSQTKDAAERRVREPAWQSR